MKKPICIIILMISMFIFSSGAFALDIPDARIHLVGDASGRGLVWVTGTGLAKRTAFYTSSAQKNQQLAILLTAISLGKTVWMRTEGGHGSLIQAVLLKNQ